MAPTARPWGLFADDGKEPGSVRNVQGRQFAPGDLRRRVERLERLPLRPATARFLLGEWPEEPDEAFTADVASPRRRAVLDLDPAWAIAQARAGGAAEALALIAESPWWPTLSRESADVLTRLWRHDLAVSLAARRLAREAEDADPDAVARAGLLHGLGRWLVAAVEPEWLVSWLVVDDPGARRLMEVREFGMDLERLGREHAERLGCDRLVVDANWLSGTFDKGLEGLAAEPRRVVIVRQARRLASRTPWALSGSEPWGGLEHEPRVKLLNAEVQSRCTSPFVDLDGSPREEALARSNARLRRKLIESAARADGLARFVAAFASADPVESPETWAQRAGQALCGEPGVHSARVDWVGLAQDEPRETPANRPPDLALPIIRKGEPLATINLWLGADRTSPTSLEHILPAWRGWAGLVADRARLGGQLEALHQAFRRQAETEEPRLRSAKLEALAEFAAGSGHELNNPLAVVVGRAQLLLVGETDPKRIRSLRAILTQAQRAHRILRDLMYVARPAEPRPRFCQPDEIVRTCLRDARADAEERGIKLVAEAGGPSGRAWADPDALRHVADSLVKNALEACARGGVVRFSTSTDAASLRWTVHDTGRGLSPSEAAHLFDPFFCGREAGRGLGMGLPRVARFLSQAGGEIEWYSAPGQGASFHVRLPLAEPPRPPEITTA